MSFNRLIIQSLQAERQRAAYAGLSGLGETRIDASYFERPSVDYVKAGDVIRVNVVWTRANDWFVFDTASIYNAFRNALGRTFNVSAMSPVENWTPGGTIAVDVQTRGDFSRLNDVVSIVASNAQSAGLSVDVSRTRGEFVSKAETTGGAPVPTIRDPREQSGSGIESFFNNLTQSPVTLAVILGAAVVLVIAAKR